MSSGCELRLLRRQLRKLAESFDDEARVASDEGQDGVADRCAYHAAAVRIWAEETDDRANQDTVAPLRDVLSKQVGQLSGYSLMGDDLDAMLVHADQKADWVLRSEVIKILNDALPNISGQPRLTGKVDQ